MARRLEKKGCLTQLGRFSIYLGACPTGGYPLRATLLRHRGRGRARKAGAFYGRKDGWEERGVHRGICSVNEVEMGRV